jgi:hypothetical protein
MSLLKFFLFGSLGLFLAVSNTAVGSNGEPGSAAGILDTDGVGASVITTGGLIPANGLKIFYRKFGHYRVSVDAVGSNKSSHVVNVYKPHAKAVVDKAFLMAATYSHVATPNNLVNGDVKLNRVNVSWMQKVINPWNFGRLAFISGLADVTAIVKPRLNSAGKGIKSFKIVERSTKNSVIDGEILVVVWKMPKKYVKRTVALMFGGLKTAGDRFEITMKSPINPTKKGSEATMGLGITYGFQGSIQFSQVDVNGKRMTTSAGGQDDGASFNGALITAGGLGDLKKNPADPFAKPTGPRSDDELYNLLKFITKTDRKIVIDTHNPSDDDNVMFAWFQLSANIQINKDTDGDGLLDDWEKNGYDHDGDGVVDVDLPAMGANYRKKDIFVECDYLKAGDHNHRLTARAANKIKNAFARAPVSNPDGTRGIKIHIDRGNAITETAANSDLNPVWTEFDAIKAANFQPEKAPIYHYCLMAHKYSGGSSSGLSRGIPASDFIVSLGGWTSVVGTMKEQAGTMMHELGHNLGLRHGGGDHVNFKPNYLSIMSYFFQVDWLKKNGRAYLDYSRLNVANLDENALREKKGLTLIPSNNNLLKKYGTRWFDAAGVSRRKNQKVHKNIDWNWSGSIVSAPQSVDINRDGSKNVLLGKYHDWKNIIYDGGAVGVGMDPYSTGYTSVADMQELTFEEYQKMSDESVWSYPAVDDE